MASAFSRLGVSGRRALTQAVAQEYATISAEERGEAVPQTGAAAIQYLKTQGRSAAAEALHQERQARSKRVLTVVGGLAATGVAKLAEAGSRLGGSSTGGEKISSTKMDAMMADLGGVSRGIFDREIPETFAGVGSSGLTSSPAEISSEATSSFWSTLGKGLADFFGSKATTAAVAGTAGAAGGLALGATLGGLGGAAVTETGDVTEALIGLGGTTINALGNVLTAYVQGGGQAAAAQPQQTQTQTAGGMNFSGNWMMLAR